MLKTKLLLLSIFSILLVSCNNSREKIGRTKAVGVMQFANTPAIDSSKDSAVKFVFEENYFVKTKAVQNQDIKIDSFHLPFSIDDEYSFLQKKVQKFIINTANDTEIVCDEGTLIKIRQSSFVLTSTGIEPKGNLELQVQEFYKVSDFIPARLSTISNGDILETGGTIHIQVFAEGQLCELKITSSVEISFPFIVKKENMALFAGEWMDNKINWKQAGQQINPEVEKVDTVAEFPGGKRALIDFYHKNMYYPDSLKDQGAKRVKMNFVIDENGIVKNTFLVNNINEGVKKIINTGLSKMPRWRPALYHGKPVKSVFTQWITFVVENDNGENVMDTAYTKEFEIAVTDSSINNQSTAGIRYYIFSTTKLGWINCDRFYNSPKQKTNLYVDCGSFTDIDLKIIFHSFKAILDNYVSKKVYEFRNIPVDEPITVVAVKKMNGETYISLTDANTSMKEISDLVFEKVTINKLKEKLQQLDVFHIRN